MKIRLTKSALASLAVATFALHHVTAAGLFGRPASSSSPSWGRSRLTSSSVETVVSLSQRKSLHEIRGGSTQVAEEGEAVDEAEQLYLPGLLDTSVVRSNTVRHASSPTVVVEPKNHFKLLTPCFRHGMHNVGYNRQIRL